MKVFPFYRLSFFSFPTFALWALLVLSPANLFAANCKSGEFFDRASSKCKICPVGHYCFSDQKYACFVGSYQDLPGQVNCKLCKEGTYQNLQGQIACQLCPKKTFSKQGYSQCSPCPAPTSCLVLNQFGQCVNGVSACESGTIVCKQTVFPSLEICDGKDNDCDGLVDESLQRPCKSTNQIGSCAGTETCDNGKWLRCNAIPASYEVCDNNDNDCDGKIDEGLSRACTKTNAQGSCSGLEKCFAGQWVGCDAKVPLQESCNNKDDDCDGNIDENLSRACKAPGNAGLYCTGVESCSAGKWANCTAQGPLPETCNGSDDDCDGKVDEGLKRACKVTNPEGTCNGNESCVNGAWGGCDARIPSFETCNGIDDNCNGKVDEQLRRECYQDNAYGTCKGSKECLNGKYTSCNAPAAQKEACNGKDDDCDGAVDENVDGPCPGFQLCLRQRCVACIADKDCRTQGRPACEPTSNTCQRCVSNKHCPKGSVCVKNSCEECGSNGDCPRARKYCVSNRCYACPDKKSPVVEVCDGKDNNCDGAVDEELRRACKLSTSVGECSGQQTCDNGKWGACSAPSATSETCNGRDDDCDGRTDNQAGSYRVLLRDCQGSCGKKGLEFCVEGRWKGCTADVDCKEPLEPEPAQEKSPDANELFDGKERGVSSDEDFFPFEPGGLDLSVPRRGCQCQGNPRNNGGGPALLFFLGLAGLCFLRRGRSRQ